MNKIKGFFANIGGKVKTFFVNLGEKIIDFRDRCNPKVLRIIVFAGGGTLALAIGLIVYFALVDGEAIDVRAPVSTGDIENPIDLGDEPDIDDHETVATIPLIDGSFIDVDGSIVTAATTSPPAVTSAPPAATTTSADEPPGPDSFVRVTFDGANTKSTVSSSGVSAMVEFEDNGRIRVEITEPGEYHITGTVAEGNIVISATGNVVLRLINANIARSDGPAIRTSREMEGSTLTIISEGTNNLVDRRPWVPPENRIENIEGDGDTSLDRNGAIFSRAAELVITGSGRLNVQGGLAHGINSRGSLSINSANISVNAPTHGIRSRLQTVVQSSTVEIVSGSKGFRSAGNNHGHVYIFDSNINITSVRDSIHAEQHITINNTTLNSVAGGGYVRGRQPDTMRGLRAGGNISINGGHHNYNCAEDGIAASGSTEIRNANITIKSNRRAIRGKWGLNIWDSNINVEIAFYGLRGLNVNVYGGSTNVHTIDNGIEVGPTGDFDQPKGMKGTSNLFDVSPEELARMFTRCFGCH